jgi:hypothetical protein
MLSWLSLMHRHFHGSASAARGAEQSLRTKKGDGGQTDSQLSGLVLTFWRGACDESCQNFES